MLTRIDELIQSNQDFSFETTLSTRSFIHTINRAKSSGYFVTLIFFWLESVELAKDRVRKRVSEGGHHIEEEVIKRRYKLGIKNLYKLYADKVDSLLIFDNSTLESDLIAEKTLNGEFMVYQLEKFNKLKTIADEG